ncbi:hypothetical protein ACETRX_27140 [Labrys portucalensis]|uniref:Phage tail tape measure protein n=1 Tax=Labrys neptuniae TaxID=376174 RepID=A0ABV6ZME4_9HYPH
MTEVPIVDFMKLFDSISALLNQLARGQFLRGTFEAALVEAQGATWVGGSTGNHLKELTDARAMLVNTEQGIRKIVDIIGFQSPQVSARLSRILDDNLFNRTGQLRTAITETETLAAELKVSNGTRFQGVQFFEGGPGGNVARTLSSLPSEQLKTPALQSQLRQGVDATLLPRAHPLAQRTMEALRQMPVTFEDIKQNVGKITTSLIGAIRLWMSQFMQQAGAAARLAMVALEQALVSFGSRLTTPLILIGRPWGEPPPEA